MVEKHKIVIVGGGVAGLDLATQLGRRAPDAFSVTLIDREPSHVWKPMLHTIAAGTQDAEMQGTSYMVHAATKGFVFHPGEVIAIDRSPRHVRLAPLILHGEETLPARTVQYDSLILAAGSKANDFGTPGVKEHCLTIDSRADAIAFNDRLRARLLKALSERRVLSVAIVGGGATGVELAAELIQIADVVEHFGATGARKQMHVTLIEAGNRILAPFPERISHEAQRSLEALGIVVRTSAKVSSAEPGGLVLGSGEQVAAELKVWAAGVQAPEFCEKIEGLKRTMNHQLSVGPTRVTDDPHIFAIGDCASFTQAGDDRPLPTTAQVAFQQSVYLSKYLLPMIKQRPVPGFRYHDFGSLVALGRYDAYGSLGRVGIFKGGFIRGKIAQLGHALLYRRHQGRIHGMFRGSLIWLLDVLSRRVRPSGRFS
jgi:NADH dehydrogenase